jgi:pilus assembly protein CpaE
LDERALAAIDHATDIVLLASLDVASVRNLGKELDALDRLGLTSARRHFVLNRADARVGLEVADVETAVGLKVEAALPSSRQVPLSMNQGRVLVLDEPESPVAHEILNFANRFLDEDEQTESTRSPRFSLRRR